MPTAAGYAAIAVQLTHSGMGRSAYVTFGVHPTATDPVAIAHAVSDAFVASGSIVGTLDNQVTINGVTAHYGVDGTEDTVGFWNTSTLGSLTFASTPPNVALLATKITTRGGRRGRGRMFIPWAIAVSFVDELGNVSSSAAPAIQTCLDTFLAQLTTKNVPMVILHRPSAPGVGHPTTPGPPNVVTQLVLSTVIATQRRRLR